jgi:hypothetical protein
MSCLPQVSKILGIRVFVTLNFGTLLHMVFAQLSTETLSVHSVPIKTLVPVAQNGAPSHIAMIVKQCFANTNVAVFHDPIIFT